MAINVKNSASDSLNEDVRRFGELIKGQKVAMLTSIDEDGSLHSRPMATLEADAEGNLWFFTREHAPKVDEITQDGHVSVAFMDHADNRYVSVRGVARLVQDPRKKSELFDPVHLAWFPAGLDDPELALLRVEVQRVDYWDAASNAMVKLAGMGKTLFTGQPYRPGPGEVGTIDLQH